MSVDTARITEIVAELDRLVSKEGALMLIEQYGGGPDESMISANQAGYLRFGIEMLRAATAPCSQASHVQGIDLEYLIPDQSPIQFDSFERREDLSTDEVRPFEARSFAGLFGAAVFVLIGIFAAVGIIAAIAALIGRLRGKH